MRPTAVPEGARFTCRSCGRCCQGWSVPVDHATVERLRAYDWGMDPFERVPTGTEPYRIKLVNGRCFFLDQENRCRIHSEISYEAKPAACRSFPLAVFEVEGTRYARLSYWCPTVTANSGKALAQQARWIAETARHADRRTRALTINETTEIGLREFERVHQTLRRFLTTTSLPVSDRLAAAATLIDRLNTAATQEYTLPVKQVVCTVEAEGAAALAVEARGRGHASTGRRVLSLFLLQDRDGGRFDGLARFVSVLMFILGAARLRSRSVPCKASWRQLRSVAFDLEPESAELLTRYFCAKLDSRRYVAGEATLVMGFNVLMAAYGIINVLARMRAASEGRSHCDEEDIRLAVGAADLLVVEHPALYQGRLQRRLTEAALGNSGVYKDILASLQ